MVAHKAIRWCHTGWFPSFRYSLNIFGFWIICQINTSSTCICILIFNLQKKKKEEADRKYQILAFFFLFLLEMWLKPLKGWRVTQRCPWLTSPPPISALSFHFLSTLCYLHQIICRFILANKNKNKAVSYSAIHSESFTPHPTLLQLTHCIHTKGD